MHWQLWLVFALGIMVRWADRIQYVVSEDEARTFIGYLKHNSVRLPIRVIATCFAFWYLVDSGEVNGLLTAFSVGVGADVLVESFLERAKRTSESILKRNGGSGGNTNPTV